MASHAVDEILQRIEALNERDRLGLERELSQQFLRAWKVEAASARKLAHRRQINEDSIDLAIEKLRYKASQ